MEYEGLAELIVALAMFAIIGEPVALRSTGSSASGGGDAPDAPAS